jgi:hypothetical protein
MGPFFIVSAVSLLKAIEVFRRLLHDASEESELDSLIKYSAAELDVVQHSIAARMEWVNYSEYMSSPYPSSSASSSSCSC